MAFTEKKFLKGVESAAVYAFAGLGGNSGEGSVARRPV
jgi:hypothetical protein